MDDVSSNDSSMEGTNSILEKLKKEFTNHVTSTEKLIEFVNGCMDESLKEVMVGKVVEEYVSELKNQTLSTSDLAQLKEFASLSELHATTEPAKFSMRRWFAKLTEKMKQECGDEVLIEILSYALLPLDPEVFEGELQPLTDFAGILLEKMNPENTIITKAPSPRQCDILSALYRTFQLIVLVHPIQFDLSNNGLLAKFKTKVDKIVEAAAECFPILHYAKVIQQSIVKLGTHEAKKWGRYESRVMWKVLRGLANLWNTFQMMVTTARIDLESVEKALSLFEDALKKIETQREHQWFHLLDGLNTITIYVIQDINHLSSYMEKLATLLDKEKSLGKNDRKHLRYGIIQQLTVLALSERCLEKREEITQKLEGLRTSSGSKDIAEDKDISSFLAECLTRITEQIKVKQDELVTAEAHSQASTHSNSLFGKVRHKLIGIFEDADPSQACECPFEPSKSLKAEYRARLSQTVSPITGRSVNISALQFNLMRINDVDKVLNPCNCVQLGSSSGRELVHSQFKTKIELKELLPDDDNVSRVLVMGMPGSGKSTLAQRLALDWSNGLWGLHFQTVFLVPLSVRLKEEKIINVAVPSLSHTIVRSCFDHVDLGEYFKKLQLYVQDQLKKSTTLVIMDGVEEAKNKGTKPIINQARNGQHKLLMLGQPEVIQDKQFDVIELCPLTDKDISTCLSFEDIKSHSQVQDHQYLWELARNPTKLHILKSAMCSSETSPCPRSRACYYHDLTEQMWKVCGDRKEKEEDQSTERNDASDHLGDLALTGLELGRCRITRGDLIGKSSSPEEVLFDRGFLVFNCERNIEFTHSIMLKYFAGRRLARQLFDEPEKSKAISIIQTNKYVLKYADTLSMMAAEVGREKDSEGIRTLVRMIDQDDIESVGVHQLGLKMNFIQQWLLECSQDTEYKAIAKEFNVSSKLLCWLKMGLTRVRKKHNKTDDTLLQSIIRLLKDFPNVVKREKMSLFSTLWTELNARQWDVDDLVLEALAMVINSSEEFKDDCRAAFVKGLSKSTKTSYVLQFIRRLSQLSKSFSRQILKVLKTTISEKRNDLFRETVIDVIGRLPDCSEADISLLAEVCRQTKSIEATIVEAIPEILINNPQHVVEFVRQVMEDHNNTSQTSPAIIEVLGVYLKKMGQYEENIVDKLLSAWPQMDEKQRKAASQTFIEAIRVAPEKTISIVGTLLGEEAEISHSQLMPVLKTALVHRDLSIRSLALNAIGIIANGQSRELQDELISIIKACITDKSDDKHMALEAARNLAVSDADIGGLMTIILDVLKDPSAEIRNLGGRVLRAAAVQPDRRNKTVSDLCQMYWASNDDTKHGIVHCLHLIVQDFPETVFQTKNVLIKAAESPSSMLCSAGVSALSILVQQPGDVSDFIDVLIQAYQRSEADILSSALEALAICVRKDPNLFQSISQYLKPPPNSQSIKEWEIYLSLLKQAVTDPQKETLELFEMLVSESSKELPEVRKKRREIIDQMPFDWLLNWYKLSHQHSKWSLKQFNSTLDNLVVRHISRRFYQSPMLLDKSTKTIEDLTVEERRKYSFEESMKTHLKSNISLPTKFPETIEKMKAFLPKRLRK